MPDSGKWKNFFSAVSDHAKSEPFQVWIFIIFAIIIYEIDFWWLGGLSFSVPSSVTWLLYAFLFFIGILWFRVHLFSEKGREILILCLLSMLIPRLAAFLGGFVGFFDIITAVLFISPPWLIYAMYNTETDLSIESLQKFGRLYLFVIIFIAVFTLIIKLNIGSVISQSEADLPGGSDILKLYFITYPKRIGASILDIPTTVRTKINQSLGMNYFTGRVEQNKDEPFGVYIEDVRATEPVFYEGNSVVIWATLRGKSFEGNILIRNGCYAVSDDEIVVGRIYPVDVNLFYDESMTLECVFEGDNQLSEGRYTIKFSSTFDFPTWGYVTYTYVDKETSKSYYIQKKNINNELSIPRKSNAIFTNGPAGIGVNSLDMPISVDTNNPYLPSFGTTLYNLWSHGEIVTINNLEIVVPKDLVFDSCIPAFTSKESSPTFDTYKFVPDFNTGQLFTTVTCRPRIANIETFLGTNIKSLKTIAINASYKYTLDESTSINVRKVG